MERLHAFVESQQESQLLETADREPPAGRQRHFALVEVLQDPRGERFVAGIAGEVLLRLAPHHRVGRAVVIVRAARERRQPSGDEHFPQAFGMGRQIVDCAEPAIALAENAPRGVRSRQLPADELAIVDDAVGAEVTEIARLGPGVAAPRERLGQHHGTSPVAARVEQEDAGSPADARLTQPERVNGRGPGNPGPPCRNTSHGDVESGLSASMTERAKIGQFFAVRLRMIERNLELKIGRDHPVMADGCERSIGRGHGRRRWMTSVEGDGCAAHCASGGEASRNVTKCVARVSGTAIMG